MRDLGSISIKEKISIVFLVLQGAPIMGLRRFTKMVPIRQGERDYLKG